MTKRKPQITITEAERWATELTIDILKKVRHLGYVGADKAIDTLQHLLDRSKRDDK